VDGEGPEEAMKKKDVQSSPVCCLPLDLLGTRGRLQDALMRIT
jgi:hypothetical protein